MARVVDVAGPWQVMAIECDRGGRVVLLSKKSLTGPRLSIVTQDDRGREMVDRIRCPKTLRALARAILRTVPAPKKRNTKRRK